MISIKNYKSPNIKNIITISTFLGFSISTAIAINILPWQIILALAGSFAFIGLTISKPIWAITPYLMVSFYYPSLPTVDVITICTLLAILVTQFGKNNIKDIKNEVPTQYLILYAIVVSTTIYGLTANNSIQFIYREGRVFLHFLWLVPLLAITRNTANRPSLLINILLATAVSISLIAIYQAITGNVIVTTGRVADLDNISSSTINTVRVQIPGFSFVMFGLIFCFSLLINKPKQIFILIPIMAVFALAIIVNYGRALWFWTAFGIFVAAILYKGRGISFFIISSLISISIFLAIASIYKPELISTISNRIVSTFQEGGGNSSFGWRQQELKAGLEVMTNSAGFGVGMGGTYRPASFMLASWEDFPRYTHNTYLFIALKLSILGLFTYLSLIYYILKNTWNTRNSVKLKTYGIPLFAFTLSFSGLCITQPEFMEHAGATLLAFCIAITSAIKDAGRICSLEGEAK